MLAIYEKRFSRILWASCCTLSSGGSIWHRFCFTNFSSKAVSSAMALSTRMQICSRWS